MLHIQFDIIQPDSEPRDHTMTSLVSHVAINYSRTSLGLRHDSNSIGTGPVTWAHTSTTSGAFKLDFISLLNII